MQGGVDGPLRQVEGATAAAANLANHRIAVSRAARQGGEHDHVEMTLEHFAFHHNTLGLAALGVNADDG